MAIREVTINSWANFTDLLAGLRFDTPLNIRFLFRGQGRAAWLLTPSLFRATAGLTSENTLAIEQAALHDFRRQAHLYIPPRIHPDDDDDVVSWWLVMQHHGAPTRLLDWTRSPYVGLYFAVVTDPEHPGALWILDGAAASKLLREPDLKDAGPDHPIHKPDAPDTLFYFLEPKYQTDRMAAQQTALTIAAQVRAIHSDVLERVIPQDATTTFFKAIIPAATKPKLLMELHRMNVTARSLFPGIDGLGKSIAEFVHLATIALTP